MAFWITSVSKVGQKCCGSGTSAVAEAGISGQAHRVTIARNQDTRPVTRLASLLITALREMSVLGHKQTSRHVRVMCVIPLKADIRQHEWHVRLVP